MHCIPSLKHWSKFLLPQADDLNPDLCDLSHRDDVKPSHSQADDAPSTDVCPESAVGQSIHRPSTTVLQDWEGAKAVSKRGGRGRGRGAKPRGQKSPGSDSLEAEAESHEHEQAISQNRLVEPRAGMAPPPRGTVSETPPEKTSPLTSASATASLGAPQVEASKSPSPKVHPSVTSTCSRTSLSEAEMKLQATAVQPEECEATGPGLSQSDLKNEANTAPGSPRPRQSSIKGSNKGGDELQQSVPKKRAKTAAGPTASSDEGRKQATKSVPRKKAKWSPGSETTQLKLLSPPAVQPPLSPQTLDEEVAPMARTERHLPPRKHSLDAPTKSQMPVEGKEPESKPISAVSKAAIAMHERTSQESVSASELLPTTPKTSSVGLRQKRKAQFQIPEVHASAKKALTSSAAAAPPGESNLELAYTELEEFLSTVPQLTPPAGPKPGPESPALKSSPPVSHMINPEVGSVMDTAMPVVTTPMKKDGLTQKGSQGMQTIASPKTSKFPEVQAVESTVITVVMTSSSTLGNSQTKPKDVASNVKDTARVLATPSGPRVRLPRSEQHCRPPELPGVAVGAHPRLRLPRPTAPVPLPPSTMATTVPSARATVSPAPPTTAAADTKGRTKITLQLPAGTEVDTSTLLQQHLSKLAASGVLGKTGGGPIKIKLPPGMTLPPPPPPVQVPPRSVSVTSGVRQAVSSAVTCLASAVPASHKVKASTVAETSTVAEGHKVHADSAMVTPEISSIASSSKAKDSTSLVTCVPPGGYKVKAATSTTDPPLAAAVADHKVKAGTTTKTSTVKVNECKVKTNPLVTPSISANPRVKVSASVTSATSTSVTTGKTNVEPGSSASSTTTATEMKTKTKSKVTFHLPAGTPLDTSALLESQLSQLAASGALGKAGGGPVKIKLPPGMTLPPDSKFKIRMKGDVSRGAKDAVPVPSSERQDQGSRPRHSLPTILPVSSMGQEQQSRPVAPPRQVKASPLKSPAHAVPSHSQRLAAPGDLETQVKAELTHLTAMGIIKGPVRLRLPPSMGDVCSEEIPSQGSRFQRSQQCVNCKPAWCGHDEFCECTSRRALWNRSARSC